jgi:hypothetical protein
MWRFVLAQEVEFQKLMQKVSIIGWAPEFAMQMKRAHAMGGGVL